MSEKRFIILPNNVVWDNQLNEVVCRCILEGIGDAENVCQRLNEQQATIQKQSERIKELESILADDIVRKSEIKDAWKQRTEKR